MEEKYFILCLSQSNCIGTNELFLFRPHISWEARASTLARNSRAMEKIFLVFSWQSPSSHSLSLAATSPHPHPNLANQLTDKTLGAKPCLFGYKKNKRNNFKPSTIVAIYIDQNYKFSCVFLDFWIPTMRRRHFDRSSLDKSQLELFDIFIIFEQVLKLHLPQTTETILRRNDPNVCWRAEAAARVFLIL